MSSVQVAETMVVVADRLRWVDRELAAGGRREIGNVVESWRRDWESLDTERYLS